MRLEMVLISAPPVVSYPVLQAREDSQGTAVTVVQTLGWEYQRTQSSAFIARTGEPKLRRHHHRSRGRRFH